MICTGKLGAQHCEVSHAAHTAKYWQYRENFNKHYIVQDRGPANDCQQHTQTNCVNDGIGQDSIDPCKFSKQGYGLPVTNINISSNGSGALGIRNHPEEDDNPMFDADCALSVSWDNNAGGVNGHRYNYAGFGSETPTQLGWYWVTLATEYELLRRSGETAQMKKTLEDLFLSLQAYRRLDMQAQCIVKEAYDAKTGTDELLCDAPYVDRGIFHFGNGHIHYDTRVKDNCHFEPDMSGYSGFFIRDDAVQSLEDCLHDPSDDRYNVDAIGSAFAVIQNDPTGPDSLNYCKDIDRFCFMANQQYFPSQDQIAGLLYGLSFIKRYIPEDAEIKICDENGMPNGMAFNILDMAQRIAVGMVSFINNDFGKHVTIPGSRDCCGQTAKLSLGEGGNCAFSIWGMLKTMDYILGEEKVRDPLYHLYFEQSSNFDSGRVFYLQLSSTSKDLSSISDNNKRHIRYITDEYDKQIFLLGNDLLFPEGDRISDAVGGQSYFRNLLCYAPCEGPCHKPLNYDNLEADLNRPFPDFECPNTANWLGERWDGFNGSSVYSLGQGFENTAKQGNGLDYMALFNMYSLLYAPNEPYYAPTEGLEASIGKKAVGGGLINGPDNVCPVATKRYILSNSYTNSTLSQITWNSSANIDLSNQIDQGVDATISSGLNPSYIETRFTETRSRNQNYSINGGPVEPFIEIPSIVPTTISDECQLYYRKPIFSEIPDYVINTDWLFCPRTQGYQLSAEGPVMPGSTFTWEIEDFTTSPHTIRTCSTQFCYIFISAPPHPQAGYGEIRLTVTVPECGSKLITKGVSHAPCQYLYPGSSPERVGIYPNPGRDVVNIILTEEEYEVPLLGVPVRIANAETGVVVKSERMYSKSTQISISQIPAGAYEIQVQLDPVTSIQKPLMIVRD